jgi:hypothetical protein
VAWTDGVERVLAHGGSARRCVGVVLVCGPIYGLAMGSAGVGTPERWIAAAIVAVKVPALLLLTASVCLPAYACVLMVLGMGRDVREACRAVFGAQAVVAAALASLAPVVLVAYTAVDDPARRVAANMALFALALAAGQLAARRRVRALAGRDRRHTIVLGAWAVLYAFVGVQLGWTLRPFVGRVGAPIEFFREGAFTNAYVVAGGILWRALGLG